MKHLLSLLLATCTLSSLSAQETVTAALLYEAGLEYGGDELLTLQFTNGEEQVMLAGQGGYASIGGELRLANVDYLALRATVGIKYNTTAADNANIAFTRIPVNIVPHFYFDEMIHVGVGITTHQRVRLNGDGFTPDVDFAGSISPRFEIGYGGCALTYSIQDYTSQAEVLSGSSFGISFTYVVPAK